jgi:transcriptional regulator with XRE-family HTH domain
MANSSGFVSYFGTELRRHRERRGWQRDQLADRVPWSIWTITSVEQGRRKPPPGFGEHVDALFNLPGVMTELAKRAQKDPTPFGDRLEIEQRAGSICEYDMRLVPGLLQTEGYARAVHQARRRTLSSEEIERLVELRMQRQEIFEREHPPILHAIIDEAVLGRRIGDAATVREQLAALTVPRQSVTIQVLPLSAGCA